MEISLLVSSSSKLKPCSNRTDNTMAPNKGRKTSSLFPACSSPAGWSYLPSELLDQIISLLSPSDQHRIRLICTAWRAVAKQSSPSVPLPFDPPRLLLRRPDSTISFFNLFNCKFLSSSLPPPHLRSRCVGYLSGWFILVSDQNASSVCLFNPTMAIEIPLPTLEFPAEKAILSAPPGFPNSVVAVMGRSSSIALCEPTGRRWYVLDLELRIFQDLTFWRNQLCALEINGNILFCNFDLVSRKTRIITLPPPSTPERGKIGFDNRFILESTSGELLLVVKGFLRFDVFKLVNDCKWEQIDQIGDQALFLGAIRSESVPARRFNKLGLRENSIYFTKKRIDMCIGVVGVYSMEDECMEAVPVLGQYSVQAEPVWISPVIWP